LQLVVTVSGGGGGAAAAAAGGIVLPRASSGEERSLGRAMMMARKTMRERKPLFIGDVEHLGTLGGLG
jgi:hypothetical protein